MRFSEGDEVLVVDGEWSGYQGTVVGREIWANAYVVQLNTAKASGTVIIQDSQAESVEYETTGEVDEVPVPLFPAAIEDLQAHLEWMLPRVLDKVGEVGPEQALFGFQQFEGKTPTEILLELMGKLEEGMAMHAQAHILLGRIVIALETLNDQD